MRVLTIVTEDEVRAHADEVAAVFYERFLDPTLKELDVDLALQLTACAYKAVLATFDMEEGS